MKKKSFEIKVKYDGVKIYDERCDERELDNVFLTLKKKFR